MRYCCVEKIQQQEMPSFERPRGRVGSRNQVRVGSAKTRQQEREAETGLQVCAVHVGLTAHVRQHGTGCCCAHPGQSSEHTQVGGQRRNGNQGQVSDGAAYQKQCSFAVQQRLRSEQLIRAVRLRVAHGQSLGRVSCDAEISLRTPPESCSMFGTPSGSRSGKQKPVYRSVQCMWV
jgi:hypothetical protein